MPRSNSNSRSSSTSTYSRPSLPPPKLWHQSPSPMKYTPAPVPAVVKPAAPVPSQSLVVQHEVPKQSFGSIIKEGIGFGAGAEIGRTAVQGIFGLFRGPGQTQPHTQVQHQPLPQQPPPQIPHFASPSYKECLENNKNDLELCKPFLSKDASPWTQCMEMNFYKAEYCSSDSLNKR